MNNKRTAFYLIVAIIVMFSVNTDIFAQNKPWYKNTTNLTVEEYISLALNDIIDEAEEQLPVNNIKADPLITFLPADKSENSIVFIRIRYETRTRKFTQDELYSAALIFAGLYIKLFEDIYNKYNLKERWKIDNPSSAVAINHVIKKIETEPKAHAEYQSFGATLEGKTLFSEDFISKVKKLVEDNGGTWKPEIITKENEQN
jgi:hypothetical protein